MKLNELKVSLDNAFDNLRSLYPSDVTDGTTHNIVNKSMFAIFLTLKSQIETELNLLSHLNDFNLDGLELEAVEGKLAELDNLVGEKFGLGLDEFDDDVVLDEAAQEGMIRTLNNQLQFNIAPIKFSKKQEASTFVNEILSIDKTILKELSVKLTEFIAEYKEWAKITQSREKNAGPNV